MKNKDNYYLALIENNGLLNEIDLGENLGLNENETSQIIGQLLAEYKIDFKAYKNCNYSPWKKKRRRM